MIVTTKLGGMKDKGYVMNKSLSFSSAWETVLVGDPNPAPIGHRR
jgi:hypothetical protein